MCDHTPSSEIDLPLLSDEAVVEIQNFLYDVLTTFESRYGIQIHRYYEDRSQHNLINTDRNLPADDPPF